MAAPACTNRGTVGLKAGEPPALQMRRPRRSRREQHAPSSATRLGWGPQTQKRDREEEPGREASGAPRRAEGAVRRAWKGGAGGPRGAQNLMAFRRQPARILSCLSSQTLKGKTPSHIRTATVKKKKKTKHGENPPMTGAGGNVEGRAHRTPLAGTYNVTAAAPRGVRHESPPGPSRGVHPEDLKTGRMVHPMGHGVPGRWATWNSGCVCDGVRG